MASALAEQAGSPGPDSLVKDQEVPNVRVVGGQELASHLGSLLAEVETTGATIIVMDKRTNRVRCSIIPGAPESMTEVPAGAP